MARIVYPAGSPGEVGLELLPRKVNLVMYAGDDFIMNVEMTDPKGEVINLTGWTGRCQIRNTARVISATITNAPDGKSYAFRVPGSSLIAGSYKYDVEFTFPNGQKKTFMYGNVLIKGEVTV